jgi:hypothetical protein
MNVKYDSGYNKKYLLTHPNEFIKEVYLNIKYACQRVVRGWDDRVIWSIDYYLATMIPIWLTKLKNNKMGVPTEMFEKSDYLDENYNISEKTLELREKQYNEILDKIIEGFNAYTESQNSGLNDPIIINKFNDGIELFVRYFSTFWD